MLSTSLRIFYLLHFTTIVLAFLPLESTRCKQSKVLLLPSAANTYTQFSPDNNEDLFEQWGVQRCTTADEFPKTLDEVIDHAFLVIAGEIYDECPPSQSIASNAMSRSLFTDRPVRKRSDSGRIGIELSGLRSLFPIDEPMSHSQALRITALFSSPNSLC